MWSPWPWVMRIAEIRGRPKLGVVVEDLAGPGTVGLAGIHYHHVLRRVADEVDLGAAGVHSPEGIGILLDVSAVDVGRDLHRRASASARISAVV